MNTNHWLRSLMTASEYNSFYQLSNTEWELMKNQTNKFSVKHYLFAQISFLKIQDSFIEFSLIVQ